MSQKGSQVSAPTHADVNVLGARVSTKESIAEIGVNPSGEEQGLFSSGPEVVTQTLAHGHNHRYGAQPFTLDT
ncbi:hypothetical protein JHK86_048282 [Glycine max]|nr:hypothetical protein JHK86_048282 [Glycine max]